MMSEEDEHKLLNRRSSSATGKAVIPFVDVPDSPSTKVCCPFFYPDDGLLIAVFSFSFVEFFYFQSLNLFSACFFLNLFNVSVATYRKLQVKSGSSFSEIWIKTISNKDS